MQHQKYSVNQQSISVLLAWVQSGEIAIPEIQRPFVWDATKVRDLMDSLYQGFPVGYVIAWQNPNVRLKDGSLAKGKKILIDGQQRVTALRAALLGEYVINKSYDKIKIKIAFNPREERFEVSNPAILKDKYWIPDIAEVVSGGSLLKVIKKYSEINPDVHEDQIEQAISILMDIPKKQIGIIDLASDLDIETVTEIFIRINSQGVVLSQADFAMSKIAANESYGGNLLRKAIDYFCNIAVSPEFHDHIKDKDKDFAKSEYFSKMGWLKDEKEDLYDPTYVDLLRVAFTKEFNRGKLSDLVSLLSGRNFETRTFEEPIAAESFERLKKSVLKFMNETDFKRFLMIIRSAGFIIPEMIRSKNALNFAFIVYLKLREQGESSSKIERYVSRWFLFSMLTGRYSGSAESTFDFDIKQIANKPFKEYLNEREQAELSDAFWDFGLVQSFESSVASSPFFNIYQAAQVKSNDKGFLSRDITVANLIAFRGDIHHIFPRNYLKKNNLTRGKYNQIANYVYMQQEINIKIGAKSPDKYFQEILSQCNGEKSKYGNIDDLAELKTNLKEHCIPESVFDMSLEHYDDFLQERRVLMAKKIKGYYFGL
ncbi:MAG: DUF262 domain-containing protein [Cyclobacteriaceae bacterium]